MMGVNINLHVFDLAVRHAMVTGQSDIDARHHDRDLVLLLRGLHFLGLRGPWNESLAELADMCEQAELELDMGRVRLLHAGEPLMLPGEEPTR